MIRPAIDPELLLGLETFRKSIPAVTKETLPHLRSLMTVGVPGREAVDLTSGGAVRVDEIVIPGQDPESPIAMTVLTPGAGSGPWPLIYNIHGGGMIIGDRYLALEEVQAYVADGLAVVASVEYRLAPEHPDPAPVTDCYRGLCWAAIHASELNVDRDHIIVTGVSAGGGLAAGIALMARDYGFPPITHQILSAPMLDDRLETHSARMLDGDGVWDCHDNLFGWTCLLGERRGGVDVSSYAAPARAVDLRALPRTYIDVGAVESFRDEALLYAQRLSEAGVGVDFHLWGGAWHGFESCRHPAVSQASSNTRREFFRRALER